MSPWNQGVAVVEDLISAGGVTRLRGADAGQPSLMSRARQQLTSAGLLVEVDPVTAYTIAYEAAKHAGMAVLAEQDLRATSSGGHVAIEKVLTAQFGGVFQHFGRPRRRRGELAYPGSTEDLADGAEARRAIDAASDIVSHAETILAQGALTVF